MSPVIGQVVNVNERPPSPVNPTDTSVWYVAGQCSKGAHNAVIAVYSIADYENKCGPRSGGQTLYDAVDLFFQEGGQKCYVLRVVGTAPVLAGIVLYDTTGSVDPGDVSLRVKAKSVGAWGNSLTVQVTDGDDANTYKLLIRSSTDPSLAEDSPSLNSIDAAVLWSQRTSQYVDITAGGVSTDARPRNVAAANMTAGTDDSGTVADAHWQTALDLATADLGPGQVSAPGRTTTVGLTQVLQHAKDRNRFALLDLANTSTVATLVTAALTLRALANNLPRYGMVCGPWITAPGVNSGASTRTIPGCALYAGLMARSEGPTSGKSPNEPAGGENGIARYALGPAVTFTDSQFDTLASAGVNLAIVKSSTTRVYGYRTLVDSVTQPNWLLAANVRLLMAIKAKAAVIAEKFVLKRIDAKGLVFKDLEGALVGVLEPYVVSKDLSAYTVDTLSVNNNSTIANRQINASIDVTIAGTAEKVTINISKTPIA